MGFHEYSLYNSVSNEAYDVRKKTIFDRESSGAFDRSTNKQEILVSIAIVTRNRRDLLTRAIKSAYAQTYRSLEFVLVDNASQDDTLDMVQKNWPNIRIIRLHRNIGCQPARNIAMRNCRGKYVFNLDDDGVLDPYAIERIVARFEEDPKLAVIDCWTPPLELAKTAPAKAVCMPERWVAFFQGGASAIRASVLDKAGYFPEFVRGGAEAVLAAYMIDCGYEILRLPSAIMYHPIARKGKILTEHTYYMGWHVLKRAYMYLPWPECFINGSWRSFRGLWESIRNRCLGAYLVGILRFFFDLPDVITQRHPICRDTVRKIAYIDSTTIYNRQDIAKYKDYTCKQMLRNRWRRWRNTVRPLE